MRIVLACTWNTPVRAVWYVLGLTSVKPRQALASTISVYIFCASRQLSACVLVCLSVCPCINLRPYSISLSVALFSCSATNPRFWRNTGSYKYVWLWELVPSKPWGVWELAPSRPWGDRNNTRLCTPLVHGDKATGLLFCHKNKCGSAAVKWTLVDPLGSHVCCLKFAGSVSQNINIPSV